MTRILFTLYHLWLCLVGREKRVIGVDFGCSGMSICVAAMDTKTGTITVLSFSEGVKRA